MLLGDIIKTLRLANGWKVAPFARRVSATGIAVCSRQNVEQLENFPTRSPRGPMLLALATAFGKSVEDLYGWRPGMPISGPNDGGLPLTAASAAARQRGLRLAHEVHSALTELTEHADDSALATTPATARTLPLLSSLLPVATPVSAADIEFLVDRLERGDPLSDDERKRAAEHLRRYRNVVRTVIE